MDGTDRGRLDKWLWHARFFRTRTLAAAAVEGRGVRINGRPVRKPGAAVRPGDTLTFVQAGSVRVVRVEALADRRGSAVDAAMLYSTPKV